MILPNSSPSAIHPWRLFLKGLALFLIVNFLLVAWDPSTLGRFSLYNRLFPGRLRLPFGENPAQAYNMSLFNLDAMFASHVIAAGSKPADEYRVILIGDSSIWGTLQRPEETLSGLLNAEGLVTCDGRMLRVYNLGYPTISLTKDLMLLDYALRYQPDLVIWSVTLEAFPIEKQLDSPLVANNAAYARSLIETYNMTLEPDDPLLVQPTFWNRTLIGRRRELADLFRLQMVGVMWAATGIDQVYPEDYLHAQFDLEQDASFHGRLPPTLDPSLLALDVLDAGMRAAGSTPILLVNEPMLISTGQNSDLRYNFFYPRWAYDQYRQMLVQRSRQNGWTYLDLWDIVPADEFTNSAIHLTPAGEVLLAERVSRALQQETCP